MALSVFYLQACGHGGASRNIEALLPALSEERRLRAERAGSAAFRRDTVFAYLLLRLALSEEYGIFSAPEFTRGEYGKPFLKENPDLFFSLSHSGGAALCALADFPVGADLQDVRRVKSGIGRKFCTPSELREVSRADDPDRALCRLWCLKESYGKFTGKGFSEGFTAIDTAALLASGCAFVTERDGFFLSVCADCPIQPPPIRTVTEEELFRWYGE